MYSGAVQFEALTPICQLRISRHLGPKLLRPCFVFCFASLPAVHSHPAADLNQPSTSPKRICWFAPIRIHANFNSCSHDLHSRSPHATCTYHPDGGWGRVGVGMWKAVLGLWIVDRCYRQLRLLCHWPSPPVSKAAAVKPSFLFCFITCCRHTMTFFTADPHHHFNLHPLPYIYTCCLYV